MSYTLLAVLAVPVALVIDLLVARTRLVLTKQWWITYAIVLIGQLATNGWLTGRRIVTYDPDAIIGSSRSPFVGDGRLVWAPVEDLGFGFALVLLTLVSWTWWNRHHARSASRPTRG